MACANAGAPHTNGSQFFITLDRCDHLDRKHTIFGKITGESIYNAMHLNDLEVCGLLTKSVPFQDAGALFVNSLDGRDFCVQRLQIVACAHSTMS